MSASAGGHDARGRRLGRVEFDRGAGFSLEDARALIEGTEHRVRSVLALHRVLDQTGELARQTLLEYRCRTEGCLLLRVFRTPEGEGVYRPPFRYSARRNARSDPRARKERTTDGDRRWVERADLLSVLPVGSGLEWWVTCDHLLDFVLAPERIAEDLATRPASKVLLLP